MASLKRTRPGNDDEYRQEAPDRRGQGPGRGFLLHYLYMHSLLLQPPTFALPELLRLHNTLPAPLQLGEPLA